MDDKKDHMEHEVRSSRFTGSPIASEIGFRRPPPKEADYALDIFQRTFPQVNTEEGLVLVRNVPECC